MTPQEKAKQLIDYFNNYTNAECKWETDQFDDSKGSAKVLANEMINELTNLKLIADFELITIQISYWNNVLDEIEKLEYEEA